MPGTTAAPVGLLGRARRAVAARAHGEDTDAVLREVGLTDAQIATLRERGVV